jgi:protein phosphatase-4 regulatory subunit 3
LELFEYIKRESIKPLIYHLAENYRERLMGITYVNTFHGLVQKYDQFQHPFLGTNAEGDTSFTTEPDTPDALRSRMMNGRQIFSGLRESDPEEDAYFNTEDDGDTDLGDDEEGALPTTATARLPNGHASPVKPLVDYPDDDEEDAMDDILASSPDPVARDKKSTDTPDSQRGRNRQPVPLDGSPGSQQSPPESIATKRRRAEEDDDDELGKMMGGGNKRRNSSASLRSAASDQKVPVLASSPQVEGSPMSVSYPDDTENEAPLSPKSQPLSSPAIDQQQHTPTHALRRKGSLKVKNEGAANPGRFAIKPIDLSGGRTPTDSPLAKDGQTNGNGNGNANANATEASEEVDGETSAEGGGG